MMTWYLIHFLAEKKAKSSQPTNFLRLFIHIFFFLFKTLSLRNISSEYCAFLDSINNEIIFFWSTSATSLIKKNFPIEETSEKIEIKIVFFLLHLAISCTHALTHVNFFLNRVKLNKRSDEITWVDKHF